MRTSEVRKLPYCGCYFHIVFSCCHFTVFLFYFNSCVFQHRNTKPQSFASSQRCCILTLSRQSAIYWKLSCLQFRNTVPEKTSRQTGNVISSHLVYDNMMGYVTKPQPIVMWHGMSSVCDAVSFRLHVMTVQMTRSADKSAYLGKPHLSTIQETQTQRS